MNIQELDFKQLDALREIGNIGSGNAASSLAQMTSKKIDMSVPEVKIIPFNKIFSLIGSEEEEVICINLKVHESLEGTILLLFTKESAFKLVDMLMGYTEGNTKELDEMGASVLQEVGNILCAAFLNAISMITGYKVTPSVPALAYDMLNAVLSSAYVESGQYDDYSLVINTCFYNEGVDLNGYFFMLPNEESLEKILASINML